MPTRDGGFGDLLVQFDVIFPEIIKSGNFAETENLPKNVRDVLSQVKGLDKTGFSTAESPR